MQRKFLPTCIFFNMAQTLDHCYVKTIKFTLSSLGHLHSTVVTSGYFCFHPLAMVLVFFPFYAAAQQPQSLPLQNPHSFCLTVLFKIGKK